MNGTMRGALALAFVLLLAPSALAQEAPQPIARARVTPEAAVTVGQPVTVEVEVLVPTFFRGAPRFPELDVADALVIFNDRGRNLSERRGGRSWAGQSRSYTIYPQRAGTYEIPRIEVEVPYSAGGANVATATVSSDPVSFEAAVPPGAEGLGYFIATSALTLGEEIEPAEAATLRVGESLTRTVTVTVQDALSMVVPPLDLGAPDGLAAYPAQPVVTDTSGERGARIVGTRIESTTFVAEREGSYVLPTVELVWWDVGSEELRRSTAGTISIEVVANPDLVTEFALPGEDEDTIVGAPEEQARISLFEYARRYGVPLLVVALVAYAVSRLARRFGVDLGSLLRGDPEAREERRLFGEFRDAARTHRARETARAFMRWLDFRNRRPGTYAAFASSAGDKSMDREARALGEALYGRPSRENKGWGGDLLARRVDRVRHRSRKQAAVEEPALPPLNPR